MAQIKIYLPPPTGNIVEIKYLHSDTTPDFSRHGEREVHRVSDVEPDKVIGQKEWVATLMDGQEISRSIKRDEVLQEERRVIEERLFNGKHIPIKD